MPSAITQQKGHLLVRWCLSYICCPWHRTSSYNSLTTVEIRKGRYISIHHRKDNVTSVTTSLSTQTQKLTWKASTGCWQNISPPQANHCGTNKGSIQQDACPGFFSKDAISVPGNHGVPQHRILRFADFIGNLQCFPLTFVSKCEMWKMKDPPSLWSI